MKNFEILYEKIKKKQFNWAICIVFCLLSGFNTVYFSSKFFSHPISDFENGYHIGAYNLKNGQGYTNSSGQLITHWPPGYSIFIMPFISSDREISAKRLRIVNGFLSVVWIILLFIIFRKILSNTPTFVPLGLAVFWPPMLAIGNPELSELLFATIITLSIYALIHLLSSNKPIKTWLISILAGFLFGYATLIKTLAFPSFLFTIIVLFFLWKEFSLIKRSKFIFVMILSFLAIIYPWLITYHNYTGHWGFTTAGLHSIMDGINSFPDIKAGEFLISRFDYWISFRSFILDLGVSLKTYPGSTLYLFFIKSIKSWYGTSSGNYESVLFVLNIPLLILFLFSSVKIINNFFKTPLIIIIAMVVVLSFWLTSVLVLPLFRYLSPVFPFVILIIFYGLFYTNNNFKIKKTSLEY